MDSEECNENNNNVGSIQFAALVWFQERLAAKEEISMPGFCKRFGFKCEQDAHAAFSIPLSSTEIPQATREALSQKYEVWRRNEAADYWAAQEVDYTIDVQTKKTVKSLVDRSQYFADRLLLKRPRDETEGTSSTSKAVGSSSAPTTSTPVLLKRGRTSQRKTVSAAKPATIAPSPAPSALSAPMASDTVPTFDPSAFGSSRPQISHPWHDLVRATLFLYEGEDVELPSEQSGVTEQDPEKRVLYKLALRHLQNAQAEMQRSN
ncbi:hypothetical protein BGZ46_005036, partial [Entomortierella lignicola]